MRIEALSRMRRARRAGPSCKDLSAGKVDIIVGTHRLLGADVYFKDLGLVVVDEEQRFGVSHKERLKKLRKLVDVLTLTATPIPRTLHLSLAGMRDLSIIATPPEDRRAIRTFVHEVRPGRDPGGRRAASCSAGGRSSSSTTGSGCIGGIGEVL